MSLARFGVLLATAPALSQVEAFGVLPIAQNLESLRHGQLVITHAMSYPLNDIMDCANSDGLCEVDMMENMLRELDEVNQVCDAVGDNFEQPAEDCDEESLQLRQMLKDALAMRVQLSKMDGKIRQKQSDLEKQASYASMLLEEEFDHSFDHYVDYKSMAQYESH